MGWRGLSKALGFVSQSPALFRCHIALVTLHLLTLCLECETDPCSGNEHIKLARKLHRPGYCVFLEEAFSGICLL